MRCSSFAAALVAAVALALPAHAGRQGQSYGSPDADHAHKHDKMREARDAAPKTAVSAGAFDGTTIRRTLGKGAAETIVVTEGATVRLIFSSDTERQLHLHGYDLVAVAGPGTPAVFTFEAEHTGRFAVVTHNDGGLLTRKEVALAYVEVRPE